MTEKARADALAAVASATLAGSLPVTPQVEAAGGSGAALPAGPLATEYVQYGETPFAGVRLDRLRAIAATLEAQDFKGNIRIESFVGDFCLTGNAGRRIRGGRVRASPRRNATWSAIRSTTRSRRRSGNRSTSPTSRACCASAPAGAIEVEIVNAGRQQPVAYPAQEERTTAGDWNVVAAQNNRVEFHLVPAA